LASRRPRGSARTSVGTRILGTSRRGSRGGPAHRWRRLTRSALRRRPRRRATARPARHQGSSPPDSWRACSGSSRRRPIRHPTCALIRPSSLPTAGPWGPACSGALAERLATEGVRERNSKIIFVVDKLASVSGWEVSPNPLSPAGVRNDPQPSSRIGWQELWQVPKAAGTGSGKRTCRAPSVPATVNTWRLGVARAES
jgi:hypothetical protein